MLNILDRAERAERLNAELLATLKVALVAVDEAMRLGGPSFLGYAVTGDKIRAAIAKAEAVRS